MANLSNINGKFVVEQTTGYVGVGTTDPSYLLHMSSADTTNGTRLIIENTNASGKEYGLIADNTGVFSLRDLTAGSDRLTISSGGDVGIGTTGPIVKLAVKSSQEQLTLSEGDLRGATFDYRSSTGNLNIATNGINARTNPHLTLNYIGNFGIGTDSPAAPLAVQANFGANGSYTTSGWAKYIFLDAENTGGGGIIWTKQSSTYNRAILNNQGKFEIGRSTANDNSGAWLSDLAIDATGNVGIGTDSPSTKLEVVGGTSTFSYGDITPAGTASSVYREAVFGSTDTANTGITIFGSGQTGISFGDAASNIQGQVRYQHSTNTLELGTSSFLNMFIDSAGNVGIGIPTPYSKLQVNGAANTLCAHFGGQNNTNGHYGGISLGYAESTNAGYRKVAIVAQATGDGAARQNLVFLVDSAADGNSASIADNKMILNYDGQIKIGNGSNIAISTNAQHYHAAGPSGLSMREYEGYFDIANGTSLDLFENSSAYSDIQMVQISIVMYHSSRTYFAGMGTIGGYGMALTGAGIGQSNGGLTSAAVSTGIRKLQLTNNAGFNAVARIYIQIRSESGITIHNGSISAPY